MKRKTSISKIASILVALAFVWGGVACTQPETPAPTTYTITFDSGVESISVEEGAVAKEPATKPTKDGYEFIEWLNGTEAYNWALPVTSNLSLTAKWSAIKYTITYLPDGVKTDNPTTYTIESETITLKEPTLEEGKYFIAWHVDTEEGKVETEIAKGSTGNKTFYAEISSEKPCIVTFYDGTKKLTSVNTKKDSKVTLPAGYEKYNFFSDKECKNAFDITTPITADTTIYVKVKTFTVTFDSGVEAVTVEYEGTVKEPTAPTNGDKVFVGWYDGDKKFDFTTKITKDIKLTAKWAVTAIDTLWAAKDTAVTNPVTLPGWGYVSSYVDDEEFGKVLALNLPEGTTDAGYCRFAVELPEAKDLSEKLIKVIFKADADTAGKIKPLIYSTDGEYSEHNSTNVEKPSEGWEYKYASVADMWDSGEYDASGSLVATHKADKTKVNKIELSFQNCPANLLIAQLSICDDYDNTNEEIIWSANALSVANPYEDNATVEYVDDSVYTKVYKVDANGSYGVTTVSLPAPAKDLTAYEYLQITLKSSVATGTNVKVCIFSDATHGSENNGCTITEDELGEWKTIRLKLSEFWTAWSSDSSIKDADLSKISSLKVDYGSYKGTLEIADISLVKIVLE